MPRKAENRELKELARITDKVRKEMTQTISDWVWRDWAEDWSSPGLVDTWLGESYNPWGGCSW